MKLQQATKTENDAENPHHHKKTDSVDRLAVTVEDHRPKTPRTIRRLVVDTRPIIRFIPDKKLVEAIRTIGEVTIDQRSSLGSPTSPARPPSLRPPLSPLSPTSPTIQHLSRPLPRTKTPTPPYIDPFQQTQERNVLPESASQHVDGLRYLRGDGVNQDYGKAFQLFQIAASQGYTESEYHLGRCYEKGLGVKKDLKKAVECYQKATYHGHSASQWTLGFCYHNGIGVDIDLKKAVALYQIAATQGQSDAQCALAHCYRMV